MKKAVLFLYLLILTNVVFAQEFAQEYKDFYGIYASKNPNGVTETLKIDATKVYYFSTISPKEVELKVKRTSDAIFISFPNETKTYEFFVTFGGLLCLNVDGSIQKSFTNTKLKSDTDRGLGTYKTQTKNGIFEFLDFRFDYEKDEINPIVSYWTSTNMKKIALICTKLEDEPVCMGNYLSCELQFPNDKTVYKIIFEVEQEKPHIRHLIYTNTTDKTMQKFELVKK